MIEDSIISSPSKFNKSIRESRQERQNKRKKVNQSIEINSDHEQSSVNFNSVINEFYIDSDDESFETIDKLKNSTFLVGKPSAILSVFKPFELEKSLVMADHMLGQQRKPNVLQETEGFIPCTSLNKTDLKTMQEKTINKKKVTNSVCIITESEMINCCHQAEKIFENTIPTQQDNAISTVDDGLITSRYSMELVNSILQDFSQSPLRKEQIVTNISWQYTPEFRMNRQPVKYYSRKSLNIPKRNLNQRFAEHSARVSPENDDDCSSCSSLSIQEDVTISENLNNQSLAPTNTNNTQRLCKNLLNLSQYFTQNQSHESDVQQDTNNLEFLNNRQDNHSLLRNIPDLIKDILSLRLINYNRNALYDSYNSIDNFHGFSCIGHDDEERNVIDIDESEEVIMNETSNINHGDLNICDIRFKDKSINEEDNPGLDNFNEDDCHDIFTCINNEKYLQEINTRLLNVIENTRVKSADSNENCIDPEILNQNYASLKPIGDLNEAHKLSDEPAFEENDHVNNCDTKTINKDDNTYENLAAYEWNDDCDLFLNIKTPPVLEENPPPNRDQQYSAISSTSELASLEIKTAGGKKLHISEKAKESVQKLLNEFTADLNNDYNYEEELKEIKSKAYAKSHNLPAKESAVLSSKDQLNINVCFQTAKGKNISISKTAQQSVKNLLMDIEQNHEDNLETIKQKINKKNIEIKQHSVTALNCTQMRLNKDIDISKEAQEAHKSNNNYIGFNTANGKTINTSTEAQKRVQKLLEEFNKTTQEDFLNDLISVKNNINKGKYNDKKVDKDILQTKVAQAEASNITLSEFSFEKFTELDSKVERTLLKQHNEEKSTLLSRDTNMGFHTANGNKIAISAKAQATVENLLQEFNTVADIEQYENEIKDMKTKIQIKNNEIKTNVTQEYNEHVDIINVSDQLHASSIESNKEKLITNLVNGKRKNSRENIDSESQNMTPPFKVFKKSLHTSKSSFAEQSLKSPLTSAAHSVILRKNLLSLTKRRKSRRNLLPMSTEETPKMEKEIYEINVKAGTPIKSCISLEAVDQNPATPNLKEFFSNAPLTSTPEIINPLRSQQTIEDSDLKPIIWKNNDDSISNKSVNNSKHTTKLSDSSALNITLNSSNPTAKERIGRLKMYGKAPDVSPILIETNKNCSPSGLRRTRSMLNKT